MRVSATLDWEELRAEGAVGKDIEFGIAMVLWECGDKSREPANDGTGAEQ